MSLAQNWPKTAKSSWHCPFKLLVAQTVPLKALLIRLPMYNLVMRSVQAGSGGSVSGG